MNHATTLIGPYGALVPVRCPAPAMAGPGVRPNSTVTLLSGAVRGQRAPQSSRTWAWNIAAAPPADLRWLAALEAGALGEPPWRWYSQQAAALNMLPDAASTPGREAGAVLASAEHDNIPPGITVDGVTLAHAVVANLLTLPARGGLLDPVPVIPGRTYTASCYTAPYPGWAGDGATVRLVWRDTAGVVVDSDDGDFATGRPYVTAAAPAGAAGVTVEIECASDVVLGAVQLVEADALSPWHIGQGIPRVMIAGLGEALRIIAAGQPIRDASCTVIEVN